MADKIQIRRDTAANWTSANPVLDSGEPAYETDTRKHKTGDGSSAWNTLPYRNAGIGLVRSSGAVVPPVNSTTYWLGHNLSTAAGVSRIYVPLNCVIKATLIGVLYFGTPTSETFSVSISINGTETLLSSSFSLTGGGGVVINQNFTGLTFNLTAGHYFAIKIVTPAWATPPTQLYAMATTYFEN